MPTATATSRPGLTRRGFLTAVGTTAAAAATLPGTTTATDPVPNRFETPGQPSRDAYHALADADRRQQQQQTFDTELNAVEALGLDPSGTTPVNNALETAARSGQLGNTRVQFPAGTYRATTDIVLHLDQPCALIGPDATLKLDADTQAYVLNIPTMPGGVIDGFTIDMTADNAVAGLRIKTTGYVEARNITIKGHATSVPYTTPDRIGPLVLPVAETPDATVRLTNLTAVGGGDAGLHRDPGKPGYHNPDHPNAAPENRLDTHAGVYVGPTNKGTVQIVNATLRGWENGLYCSKTPGEVHVIGGLYWNNDNGQVRIGGPNSFADGCTIILDDRRYPDDHTGRWIVGQNQGVNAVRIETGAGRRVNQSGGTALRNLDIHGLSMQTSSSLIDAEGSSGAVTVRNCRLRNDINGTPAVLGEPPGSQGPYSAAPGPQAITVEHSRIHGTTNAPAVDARNRPQSRVKDTCIDLPNAVGDVVQGADTENVGYGGRCTDQGLTGAVGADTNVSRALAAAELQTNSGAGAETASGITTVLTTALAAAVTTMMLVVGLVVGGFAVAGFFLKKLLDPTLPK